MAEPPQQQPSYPALRSRYLLSPDVVLMPFADGTAQLVDLDGSFYGLSEIAALMLKSTLERGEHGAFQQMAAHYNAELDRIRADLAELLRTLRAKGLIGVLMTECRRPGCEWQWPWLSVTQYLRL